MGVDASKMAGIRRRGLGSPPKDGAPGLEGTAEADVSAPVGASEAVGASSGKITSQGDQASGNPVERHVAEEDGAIAAAQVKRRAPAAREEPRIPFTTRVTISTKERLEEACYHLRTKHQAFIDEAIRVHLEKNGF